MDMAGALIPPITMGELEGWDFFFEGDKENGEGMGKR